MPSLGFRPSSLRFVLACLGVAVGLTASPGLDARSEVLQLGEAARPSGPAAGLEGDLLRLAASPAQAGADGALSEAELRRRAREIGYLSTFFGRLAAHESDAETRGLWEDLRLGYAAAGGRLGRLLDEGQLTLEDLPEGQRGEVTEAGIVLDESLDGAWLVAVLRGARLAGEDDWQHTSRLSSLMIEALAGLEGYSEWIWFSAHLKRSPVEPLLTPENEPRAGPLLARFWFIQDWYLWASVAAQAADEPRVRELWSARRRLLEEQAQELFGTSIAALGAPWQKALLQSWEAQRARTLAVAETFSGVRSLTGYFPEAPRRPIPAEQADGPTAGNAQQAEDIRALRGRLAQLEDSLGNLSGELQSSRGKATRLEDELRAARRQAAKRDNAESQLQRAYAELEAARKANQARVEELVAARKADQTRVTELEQRLAELRREITESRKKSSAVEGAITETQREAGNLESGQGELRDLLQAQGRQIAAERRRVEELEGRLAELISQLSASREDVTRYQQQIDENQAEITRYRDELLASSQMLARYREELDAAQDRRPGGSNGFLAALNGPQAAMITLAVLLLLLSAATMLMLMRRTAGTAPLLARGTPAEKQSRRGTRTRRQATAKAAPSQAPEPRLAPTPAPPPPQTAAPAAKQGLEPAAEEADE